MRTIQIFCSLLLFFIIIVGCSNKSNNYTAHSLSSSQLEEIREGEEMAKKILIRAKFSENQEAIDMVEKVGKRLIEIVDNDYDTTLYQWDFFVIENKWRANAFCLAGGKIFIFSGLFPYIDNEDELALVLAHEMVHALAHHQKKRVRGKKLSDIGKYLASAVIMINPFSLPFVKKMELKESNILVDEFFLLPYVQSHEYEADALGLTLMQKAGYNPHAGLTFWSKFPKESRIKPEYLSTHPSTKNRLKKIKLLIDSIDLKN